MKRLISVTVILSFSLMICGQSWQNLNNGKDFSSWEILNGTADYHLEGDMIVGTCKLGTPNTFLATKEKYGDFILEFEVYDDPRLNSGVQIRSQSYPEYKNGRVHGYQVEIDPSPRAYSGGIYDEARRGWLYTLAENKAGRLAFVNGKWNAYRIEAIGHSLRVWINGVMTANLIDDFDQQGFIALQVHSIGDESIVGAQVKWRKLRIMTSDLEAHRWPAGSNADELNLIPNTLSPTEIKHGWRLLWDGETTEGWRSARSNAFPQRGWSIENGILSVLASDGAESSNGGDIITNDKFSDFELTFEFQLTEGANSGVKYYVDPDINQGPGSSIGLEFQILDDQHHPDAKKGVEGNRTMGSLYDLISASNLSVPANSKVVAPIGSWNRGRIISKKNHIEHWLNGFKIIEYQRKTQMFRALVAYSKYKIWPGFGALDKGHILLQDHGDQVSFRNIKIREF